MSASREASVPLTRWQYFTKTLYHEPSATGEFTDDGVVYRKSEALQAVESRNSRLQMGLVGLMFLAFVLAAYFRSAMPLAAGILLIQTILNTLGTVDILPFTGVTFPFVSNGGTSMVASWGLLAFVKAADTRQNASFAIRLPHGAQALPEEQAAEDDIPDEAEVGADAEDESVWRPDGRKGAGR